MARTALNRRLADGETYTVPAGKRLQGFANGGGGLEVNGSVILSLSPSGSSTFQQDWPIFGNAGDVFRVFSGGCSLRGWVYDA